MDDIEGRGAVVIGGGSGIGRGIALGLAGAGMTVTVADIEAATAELVRAEITATGGQATAATVDATDRASLETLANTATALGPVHVVVNTVGVSADTPLSEASEAEWAWFVEFHLMSAVRTVDVFLPVLRASGGDAHIVLTASIAGLLALPSSATGGRNIGLYTTLKHALVGYGEMLRHELAPEGIGVSVLCPGGVASNLASTSARHRPERFGGALPDPTAGRPAPQGLMANEDVGPIVVRGIRANRALIFTHPQLAAGVEARHQRVLDDFAFFA